MPRQPTCITTDDVAATMEFQSAAPRTFDRIYVAAGCKVNSGMGVKLGARCDSVGALIVDQKHCTTVPGLYAAGDVVSDLHQLCVAEAHGAVAATSIHRFLPRNFR
ncbi:FAD-dependent oxidoreductase [Bradyrhizobium sp. LHD-71]|uniref:FAD-dependent oxidoreductase n=1 Tax=Bradyrhizobium sp. LHD-71 TaxID=3072141 RepID=UPI0035BE1931